MNYTPFSRHNVLRCAVIAALFALPLLAQTPFDKAFTGTTAFAHEFAGWASLLAIIYGGFRILVGHHMAEGLFEIGMGVGLMSYAISIQTWLF